MPLVQRAGNQSKIFRQDSEPGDWVDGDVWVDTNDSSKMYTNNDGAARLVGASSFSSAAVVSHSETIGDYTQPTAAVAEIAQTNTNGGSDSSAMWASGLTRIGIKCETASSSLLTVQPITFKVYLKKVLSPTGNITCRIRNGADTTTRETSSTTLDSATLTTSYVEYTFDFAGTTSLAENDRIELLYTGGDSSNYVVMELDTGNNFDGTDTVFTSFSGSYTDTSGTDARFTITANDGTPANAVDDDTGTDFTSSQGTNPAIYVDCGGSATNLLGIALYWDALSTETEIQIRASTDTTFTSGEAVRTITVTNLTAGQWNYIRFNLVNARYLQIYGNSGSSLVLSISEIKYLTKTDSEILQDLGILEISPTDTAIGLNGV